MAGSALVYAVEIVDSLRFGLGQAAVAALARRSSQRFRCSSCGEESEQQLSDLLAIGAGSVLDTVCPTGRMCDASSAAAGVGRTPTRRMRAAVTIRRSCAAW